MLYLLCILDMALMPNLCHACAMQMNFVHPVFQQVSAKRSCLYIVYNYVDVLAQHYYNKQPIDLQY